MLNEHKPFQLSSFTVCQVGQGFYIPSFRTWIGTALLDYAHNICLWQAEIGLIAQNVDPGNSAGEQGAKYQYRIGCLPVQTIVRNMCRYTIEPARQSYGSVYPFQWHDAGWQKAVFQLLVLC
jgi:hypothetical protein